MSTTAVYRPSLVWDDCAEIDEAEWEAQAGEEEYLRALYERPEPTIPPDYSGDWALDGPEVDMFGRPIH